ncbi:MAG: hypothetical protein E6I43_02610 [Chloroflexi bacterium]|nr:MAG: hypothetical protein E6I43_02610 [Chloroflexota bacterium]
MKAESLRGSRLSAEGIAGAVLAQTLLAPDNHHRVLLLKGRILTRADWPVVADAHVEELHVVRMEQGDVHEDDAARRLAKVVAGPGVIVHGPVESQVRLSAEVNGIFKVEIQGLQALNSIQDISIFTLFDGQLVSKGKTIAGVKVTPFVVPEARLREAERVATEADGVIRVLAFRPMRVGVLVRERLDPAQREKFQASIEMKVAWFGSAPARTPPTRSTRRWWRSSDWAPGRKNRAPRPTPVARFGSPTSGTRRSSASRHAGCSPGQRCST